MQRSETITNIAPALNRAQAAVKPAAKDSLNPHFRSRYADLGAVWDACRDALAENELSVLQLPTAAEPGYCGLETILLHVSGEFVSSTAQIPLGKNEPQGYGSALTYLRRYSLAALLGIVADDDDDASAAQPPRGASHQPSKDTDKRNDTPKKEANSGTPKKEANSGTPKARAQLVQKLKRARDEGRRRGVELPEMTSGQVNAMTAEEVEAAIEETRKLVYGDVEGA
jgi:hypothetical protein